MHKNFLRTGRPFSIIRQGRDVITNPQTEDYFIDGYTVSVGRVSRGYLAWVNLGEPFYRVEVYAGDVQSVIERVAERANRLRNALSDGGTVSEAKDYDASDWGEPASEREVV